MVVPKGNLYSFSTLGAMAAGCCSELKGDHFSEV